MGYGDAIYNSDLPGAKAVAVVNGAAFPVCRALLVGGGGTANIVWADGTTATNIPLQVGYNPLRATKVTFGTASDVWAIY